MRLEKLILLGLSGAVGLGAGAAAMVAKRWPKPPAIEQPLEFNHKRHLASEDAPKIRCVECHQGAEKGDEAGLPSLDLCLGCHMKPQSKRKEEQVVREFAAKKQPFAWKSVTRNNGDIYFSHRAHVVFGKIACTECHGDVASWEKPPARPDARLLSMDACMDCHRRMNASNDCGVCHR